LYTDKFKEKLGANDQWIVDNLLMEVTVGSVAYGTETLESDIDVFGIVMDQHKCLYPQNYGYIMGFDNIPSFKSKDLKGEKNRIILDSGRIVKLSIILWLISFILLL
jgi:hypothetical protein